MESSLRRRDGSRVRALVVDDEQPLAEAICFALVADGWEVETVFRGRDVAQAVQSFHPDVIVLDVMLPDLDGFEVLARLREAREETPVLFLSARSSVADRVSGLTRGGDDYLTKPFGMAELVARARIVASLSEQVRARGPDRLRVGDLELDEVTQQAWRSGEPIALTPTEFALMRFFMRNARRTVSREQILTHVWGMDFGARSNLVDMYVSYLRRKIDDGREPMLITIRGAGFILKPAS